MTIPESALDPFSDAALADPWAIYRELRDVGPVVRLPEYDLHAVMRFEDVRRILGDWQTFSSLSVGLNSVFNEMAGQSVDTNLLMASPPQHHRLREVFGADLAPRRLREKVEGFVVERADALVDELVERGSFDAVNDLARPYVMGIIYELNGLPESGRDRFFEWAGAMFNALGPMNARAQQGLQSVGEMFGWLHSQAGRDQVTPDSWTAHIYDAVERGAIPGATAHELLSTYIAPALDTTTHSLGWAIKLFAENPDQWHALRDDPELIPGAYREILRIQAPVHHFGRRVEEDVEIDGVRVPAGAHLMVSYASGNRDERYWERPDEFDITRDNTRQLAFGYGVHACIGQGLARAEGHAILAALARRVERFEAGDGTPFLNNLVHGLDSLDVRVTRG
ncbi:cytochrome P450 [Solirubrobacter ginsenosidimutans]|nr:cytochrome P450 [Solirubrobacter ginsenosidimutans]